MEFRKLNSVLNSINSNLIVWVRIYEFIEFIEKFIQILEFISLYFSEFEEFT
jgi:hypothetical protein